MKKEDGYVLPTVLLIIVVFSVFFLAYFSQALNSTKQNEIVETSLQSVAAAEMGVEYFYHAVGNSYINAQDELERCIYEKMENDKKYNVIKSPEFYQLVCMQEIIQKELSTVKRDVPIVEGSTMFAVSEDNVVINNDKIEIMFKSTGTERGKNTELSATLTINMSNGKNDNSSPEYALPDFQSIKKPDVKGGCENPKKNNIRNCLEVLITNGESDGDYKNSGNNTKNLLLYSTQTLNIKNANKMENVNVHVEGDLIAKNLNNVKKTKVETTKDLTIESHLDLDNSKFYIGKNLKVIKQAQIKNGSFIYVEKDAIFKDGLDIDQSSKICVGGKLEGQIKNKGQIYIKSEDEQQFINKCGVISNSITWNEDIDRTIKYNN